MVRRCIKKSETVCRRNRGKIIKFVQAHRNWSVDDWKRVIFSVESHFVIGGENRTMIWRRYDEKYNRHQHETENTQKTIRVMVWGCITGVGLRNGVGLHYRCGAALQQLVWGCITAAGVGLHYSCWCGAALQQLVWGCITAAGVGLHYSSWCGAALQLLVWGCITAAGVGLHYSSWCGAALQLLVWGCITAAGVGLHYSCWCGAASQQLVWAL